MKADKLIKKSLGLTTPDLLIKAKELSINNNSNPILNSINDSKNILHLFIKDRIDTSFLCDYGDNYVFSQLNMSGDAFPFIKNTNIISLNNEKTTNNNNNNNNNNTTSDLEDLSISILDNISYKLNNEILSRKKRIEFLVNRFGEQ
jgi:hypothetical protein